MFFFFMNPGFMVGLKSGIKFYIIHGYRSNNQTEVICNSPLNFCSSGSGQTSIFIFINRLLSFSNVRTVSIMTLPINYNIHFDVVILLCMYKCVGASGLELYKSPYRI